MYVKYQGYKTARVYPEPLECFAMFDLHTAFWGWVKIGGHRGRTIKHQL